MVKFEKNLILIMKSIQSVSSHIFSQKLCYDVFSIIETLKKIKKTFNNLLG